MSPVCGRISAHCHRPVGVSARGGLDSPTGHRFLAGSGLFLVLRAVNMGDRGSLLRLDDAYEKE